jgi:hypothetical protein
MIITSNKMKKVLDKSLVHGFLAKLDVDGRVFRILVILDTAFIVLISLTFLIANVKPVSLFGFLDW